ncbi:MAG: hypothetical protein AAGN46_10420, partial [Acidobacteriota bacterium]
MRFPVRHLVRAAHALQVEGGHLEIDRALEQPFRFEQLHTSSRSLRAVVERNLVETHMHLWGTLSGDEVWADHVLRPVQGRELARFDPFERRLIRLGRATVRLLAWALLDFDLIDHETSTVSMGRAQALLPLLDQIYRAPTPREETRALKRFSEAYRFTVGRATQTRRIRSGGRPERPEELIDLLSPTIGRIRYGWTTRPSGFHWRIRALDRLHFRVIRRLLGTYGGRRPSDLANTQGRGCTLRTAFLEEVFFRYLVYHTHHWHQTAQSGRTTGLQHFKRFYDGRLRQTLDEEDPSAYSLVFDHLHRTKALRQVEGRVAPPGRGASDLLPWVVAFADGSKRHALERFGLVIHFIKSETPSRPSKQPFGRLRHHRERRETQLAAMDLFRLLRTPHPVVPFIVAIDAANVELTTPPEVFAPAFRFLREFPIELRRGSVLERFGPFDHVAALVADRQLGMTYHVGEDFRHLLSGLRAIDEVIEYCQPLPGDRLGHATALALDPEVWARQIGYQALVSRQEWLDDLVWVYKTLGSGDDLVGKLGLEDRIQKLGRQLYPGPALLSPDPRFEGPERRRSNQTGSRPLDTTPPTLTDAWRLRCLDPFSVDLESLQRGKIEIMSQAFHGIQGWRWNQVQQRVHKEIEPNIGHDDALRLLARYWYSRITREAGDEIIPIDFERRQDEWLEICRRAQVAVQERVKRRQLVVEVNPKINRLVGPVQRLSEHPIFRMTLDKDRRLRRDVRVTVNTDNPGVVATSLMHEFYLLGEILLREGVPETEVEEWLDWLRRNAESFNFTVKLPKVDQWRMREILDRVLDENRHLLYGIRGRTARNRSNDWLTFLRRET